MSGRPIRVLLIEDSPGDTRLVQEMLAEASGGPFELEHCDRLSLGLRRLTRGGLDILLLDLSLPDSSGYDTFARAYAHARGVPIIVMSSTDDETLAVKAVREGAQDYLPKQRVDSHLLGRAIRYGIERKRAEEALRESEERYALAVRGANDGIWDWNLITDEFYFSPRWKAMLGYAENEIDNRPDACFKLVHPEDIEPLKSAIAAHLAGETPHFEHEHRMRQRDGSYRWVISRGLAIRDAQDKPYRMAGSLTDLTERKLNEQKLLHSAFHDKLTALPNRALFMDRLTTAIKRSKRHDCYCFAVLFLDIDRFKVINDSLGHLVGDQLLTEIGKRLGLCLRAGDTVARLGGDEFAVLFEDIGEVSDATRVADRIQTELGKPFSLSGHEVYATASMGLAISTTGYDRAEDILRDADLAMYRAKLLGKARCELFDTSMHNQAVMLLRVETDLRRAIDRGEIRLHYQPVISLNTGAIAGFEALSRWYHPDRGVLPPDEFIPVAEETGLIGAIGRWVLQEACRQLRAWQSQFPRHPPLVISVNVSSKQFAQVDLVDHIEQTLHETRLAPRTLGLEITESTLMEDAERVNSMLHRLRGLGVQLYLDDFGTGYSSLSYLQRFPVNALKIDRSFISNMGRDGENLEIVRAIIALGQSLGISIIAEGIETAEQLAHMRQLKCDYGQGFYFSPPVNSEATQLITAYRPQ